MQVKKNRALSMVLVNLFLVTIISLSFFIQQKDAVDSSLRFAPLANGWVSHYAVLHLCPISLVEKYQKTVADDLVHGRYRPASHLITSISYAISPVFHHRSVERENRQFLDLVTGDLVILSTILILCMVLSTAVVSYVIVKYTGSYLLLIIPVLFIPFSPALTENLVQFHIDSQEIQLLFYTSLWVSSFFLGLLARKKILRMMFLLLSLLFLAFSYMAKETAVVILPVMVVIFVLLLVMRIKKKFCDGIGNWPLMLVGLNVLIGFVCTINLYLKVIKDKTKYGKGYSMENLKTLKGNFLLVWDVLGTFGINLYLCALVICIAFSLLFYNYNNKIHNIQCAFHIILLSFLTLTGCAFALIQVPWEVILSKYLLPAGFFITFAFCYSLIIIAILLPDKVSRVWSFSVLTCIVLFFIFFYKNIENSNTHYYEYAGYGTSIVDPLVDDITDRVGNLSENQTNIFIEYGTEAAWGAFVPWGRLQLQRILNIEKKFNLVDQNGTRLLNSRMPDEELTSYRFDANQKTIYVTNRREELRERKFQLVYKGYPKKDSAPEILTFVVQSEEVAYQRTNIEFRYISKTNFPEFILYLYQPIFL